MFYNDENKYKECKKNNRIRIDNVNLSNNSNIKEECIINQLLSTQNNPNHNIAVAMAVDNQEQLNCSTTNINALAACISSILNNQINIFKACNAKNVNMNNKSFAFNSCFSSMKVSQDISNDTKMTSNTTINTTNPPNDNDYTMIKILIVFIILIVVLGIFYIII
jgi:hypothetical protein